MSTIELPDDVAAALAAAAAERGLSEAELIADLVSAVQPDELEQLLRTPFMTQVITSSFIIISLPMKLKNSLIV